MLFYSQWGNTFVSLVWFHASINIFHCCTDKAGKETKIESSYYQ